MAKSYEIIEYLRPNGGWYQVGTEYEGIVFLDCEPFTKAEYQAAFDEYDAWKVQQETAKAEAKATAQNKLAALGLTVEDLTALGL
jgi:hypothetical protein